MKKTYIAPAVIMNGSVVQETRTASNGDSESANFKPSAGSVGFNL